MPRELADRLLEHLDPIRRTPATVLDLGAATGHVRRRLERRYPRARVLSVDASAALLGAGRRRGLRRLLGGDLLACAEPGALPLPSACVDLVCCNLALAWAADPERALRECRRVLRHEGLIVLCVPGPDTLAELRAAWRSVDPWPHLHEFPDMHDLGDALVRAGFSDVVVDAERLRVEFEDFDGLLRELRATGARGAPRGARGLMTPRRLEALRRAYLQAAPGPGCWASVEAVYAHAWVVDRGGVAVRPPVRGA